jgi:hypothetical protein
MQVVSSEYKSCGYVSEDERAPVRAALQGTIVAVRVECEARGRRFSTNFYVQRLMNTALIDR